MADDKWTKMTTTSAWEWGKTAGGSPDTCVGWFKNPQWLLTLEQTTKISMALTVPTPPGADRKALPEHAIGFDVLRGNDGVDVRRRKLVTYIATCFERKENHAENYVYYYKIPPLSLIAANH